MIVKEGSVTIYVDQAMPRGLTLSGRPVLNCHLFTNGSIFDLHHFAEDVGMPRVWFRGGRIPHYELTPFRRQLAIAAGAVEVEPQEAVRLWLAMRRCALHSLGTSV